MQNHNIPVSESDKASLAEDKDEQKDLLSQWEAIVAVEPCLVCRTITMVVRQTRQGWHLPHLHGAPCRHTEQRCDELADSSPSFPKNPCSEVVNCTLVTDGNQS